MSNGLIAFLGSIGASAWIFNKVYKITGGDTKRSLGATAIVGIILFLIFSTILSRID